MKKLSLQWRITLMTALLIGATCIFMNVLMGQIGIDYSKLTKEEQMTLPRVFNKSSMLKHRTKAGMRGKHRR